MKSAILTAITLGVALATSSFADTTVKISKIHLCCKGCTNAVEQAAATVQGVTAVCDKDAGTACLTAPSAEAAQEAVNAIVAAGFFGESSDPAVKVCSISGAPDGKLMSATVSGVHLCCAKCAKAANAAAMSVAGVQSSNAEKDSACFTVTGDFHAQELASALEKAGLSGKIAK